jgi:uncharacterized protein (TIGR02246 family)
MASIGTRFVALSALALGLCAPLAAQTGDEAAIRAMVRAQEAAFNTHDAAAYAHYFEADADVVTPHGWRLKGRDAYAQNLADAFKGPARAAHVHADTVSVRMLSPDLALVHITWTDTAARKDNAAIETQVLHRTAGGWLVAASQETDVAPQKAAKPGAEAQPEAKPQPERKCLMARGNGDCLIYK